MAHDLRTTLSPIYTTILDRLLKLLPRSINATALTALLETFSTMFKFLLVPSIHMELLEDTWTAVRLVLPKCLPEVQRAMAEVWGAVLRRLKTAPRTRAVTLLAKDVHGVEDASAWVIVYACKVRLRYQHPSLVCSPFFFFTISPYRKLCTPPLLPFSCRYWRTTCKAKLLSPHTHSSAEH